MRFPGPHRFFLNPDEKKALARMARSSSRVKDVDKGEISDADSSASLEEISAEDFKHDGRRSRSRVWADDMIRYSVSRNYAPNLYSFAWAQAVQNKPLGLENKLETDDGQKTGKEVANDVVVEDCSEDSRRQVEKEDGELEEGEIDVESESVAEETMDTASDRVEDESKQKESEAKEVERKEEDDMGEFDRRVGEILEELETITSEEAEASFEAVCSRLLKSFANLKTMFAEGHVPILDALVQQAFMGIQTLHSVFNSGNVKRTKQNVDLLLRFLIRIKNQYSSLLTKEQVKEIDAMTRLLVSNDLNEEIPMQNGNAGNSAKLVGDSPEKPLSGNSGGVCLPKLVPPPFSGRRVEFSPLLDLHADYDEGSLPSPTRDNAPPLPTLKPIDSGASALSLPRVFKKEEDEDCILHTYVTDAFKAVSSYQQKYGKSSILPLNQLPSPTPSEESCYDDDKQDEVSSSLVVDNAKTVKDAGSLMPVASSSSCAFSDVVTGLQHAPVKIAAQLNSLPNQVVKAKSRDPRLRFVNSNVVAASDQNVSKNGQFEEQMNSRKHKAADVSLLDDPALKRQKNACLVLNESYNNSLSTISGNVQEIGLNSAPLSLPYSLKDMAVNPAMLMELIKMEQQRLTVETQQKSGSSASLTTQVINAMLPVVVSSLNGAVVKPPEIPQNSLTKTNIPAEAASMNSQSDVGRLRMKPRDPRRILQNSMTQKNDISGPEQNKVGVLAHDSQVNKDRLTVRDAGEQAQMAGSLYLSTPAPIITQQPTKNLSTVADTVSGLLSKPVGGLFTIESGDSKIVNSCSSQAAISVAIQTNPWGDVDHLLDGYDDQQKAAIQKERSRRIAEQNKMFSAGKLCLVLDLDHTLLNSAKFGEVDQVHEEILRKKEELDRDKPLRHLFRFQHMSMWTKLRPGVWNFLEKASKLFELHLYTMGNKLYATEMAKVLDPTGDLFAGRVISRGDDGDPFDGDERVPKSKDLDGVLGMESAVVIIDDSVRVWPHNKHNLIVVERYTYFPCSRRQFGLLGPSLLEIDHDERPEDGTLASCLAVIERIHQIFFSHRCLNDIDVRHILATEQRKILTGCKIVFSRVFPVGEANPHLHPLWQTAEQFGAVCTNQIDEQVTHVVANSLGTDKVNWALSTGRFVVHPGWVEASALLYRRANEHDFAVKL